MIPAPVLTLADRRLPAWHLADDGDRLFGIQSIADWLALPFLDVRTMIELGRLPTGMEGRSHVARRTELARFFLALERAAVPVEQVAPPADDMRPAGALGLLTGPHAIAADLGCSHGGVRHRRASLGLGVFWIGKTPFARAASLDLWRASAGGGTRSTRRLATIADNRAAAAPPGSLIGAAAIAAYVGRTVRGTQIAIHRRQLPVSRVGGGIVGDPAKLASFRRHPIMEAAHGIR